MKLFPGGNSGAVMICMATTLAASSAWGVQFTAELDRQEIAQDESVSLKISVQTDSSVSLETPSFKAPDFEVIHQYQSQFAESYYQNGKVGARFMRSHTFVLRPNSTGKKTISDIQAKVSGELVKANPLTVQVNPGGAGTSPPPGYGGQGSGLRGSSRPSRAGEGVLVRAEVDKNRVYKGEQVMVSYYLLIRAQSYNAQPEKFPVLNGFLKEEVDVPLIRGQLQEEIVTLDGGVYKKILLARYAAYPLKAGTLHIDPMVLKVNYHAPRADQVDQEDDIFNQFFRQMTPRTSLVKNEPVPVEVIELPAESRPAGFSGAVGEFSIISAVNRYDTRANEPVSLTVKIEGRGNLSIVNIPKLTLPEGLQLYESRSQSKEGRGGTGERIFEYLLIPRREGEFTIPEVEFTYFDPQAKSYVTKKSEPIIVRASAGDPNLAPAAAPTFPAAGGRDIPSPSKSLDKKPQLAMQGWETSGKSWVQGLADYLTTLLLLLSLGVIGYLVLPRLLAALKRWRVQGNDESTRTMEWARLRAQAHEAGTQPFSEIVRAYEEIEARIFDVVEARYAVPLRALPRPEVREILVQEKKMPEDQWDQMSALFEFVDTVRFAHRAGAVSEDRVRNELSHWVGIAQKLENSILEAAQPH